MPDYEELESRLQELDGVIQREDGLRDRRARTRLARALLDHSTLLVEMEDLESALVGFARVASEFGEGSLAHVVATACARALDACELLRDESAGDVAGEARVVARALAWKSWFLARCDAEQAQLAVLEELLVAYGDESDPELGLVVMSVLGVRARVLLSRGRDAEVLVIGEELVNRFELLRATPARVDAAEHVVSFAEALAHQTSASTRTAFAIELAVRATLGHPAVAAARVTGFGRAGRLADRFGLRHTARAGRIATRLRVADLNRARFEMALRLCALLEAELEEPVDPATQQLLSRVAIARAHATGGLGHPFKAGVMLRESTERADAAIAILQGETAQEEPESRIADAATEILRLLAMTATGSESTGEALDAFIEEFQHERALRVRALVAVARWSRRRGRG